MSFLLTEVYHVNGHRHTNYKAAVADIAGRRHMIFLAACQTFNQVHEGVVCGWASRVRVRVRVCVCARVAKTLSLPLSVLSNTQNTPSTQTPVIKKKKCLTGIGYTIAAGESLTSIVDAACGREHCMPLGAGIVAFGALALLRGQGAPCVGLMMMMMMMVTTRRRAAGFGLL